MGLSCRPALLVVKVAVVEGTASDKVLCSGKELETVPVESFWGERVLAYSNVLTGPDTGSKSISCFTRRLPGCPQELALVEGKTVFGKGKKRVLVKEKTGVVKGKHGVVK